MKNKSKVSVSVINNYNAPRINISHKLLSYIDGFYNKLSAEQCIGADISVILTSSAVASEIMWIPEESKYFDLSVSLRFPPQMIVPGNNLELISQGLICLVKTIQSRYQIDDQTRDMLNASVKTVLKNIKIASEEYVFIHPITRNKYDVFGYPVN